MAASRPARGKVNSPSEPILLFADAGEWQRWLAAQHARSPGIWVRLSKKGAETPSVSYAEALEEAICYGWIDAQKRPQSQYFWLQRFTPRGPKSIWSKRNREKADALIAARRMQPAGLRQVERARQDGRWQSAYDSPRTAEVPDDLAAALARNAKARAFFETLDRANRYAVLWRVQTAKKPETRARRIAQFVEMLARHEKLHP